MKYGLSELELEFLEKQLIEPLKSYRAKVFLFGSRANGKYKKFSDIDLLYSPHKSHEIPSDVIYSLLAFMENSSFPYKIDLVKESDLAKSYQDSVNKEKIEL
jgi:predicted nucleotidyltransferase